MSVVIIAVSIVMAALPAEDGTGKTPAEKPTEPKRGRVVILSSADMMKDDFVLHSQDAQGNVTLLYEPRVSSFRRPSASPSTQIERSRLACG